MAGTNYDRVADYLQTRNDSVPFFRLKREMKQYGISGEEVDSILSQLLSKGEIIYTPEGVK